MNVLWDLEIRLAWRDILRKPRNRVHTLGFNLMYFNPHMLIIYWDVFDVLLLCL